MLLVLASVLWVGLPAASAHPNSVIVVNSLADTSGGAECTLRDAIIAANSNAPSGGCPAGNAGLDSIAFTVTGTITLSGVLPNLTEDLSMDGGGHITIDGAGSFRNGPTVPAGVTLNVNNLAFSHGNFSSGFGGSIGNFGSLNIADTTFYSNSAGFGGGAIYSSGSLNIARSAFSANNGGMDGGALNLNGGHVGITNSTFDGNVVQNDGGAILLDSGGALSITGTTFFSNTTALGLTSAGGALSVLTGTLTVTNTTFASNTSSVGGALFMFQGDSGTATFSHATFAENNAPSGGGAIRINGGTVTLRSSIVSNNSSGNCSGAPADGGYNLQFGGGTADSCGAAIPTADPLLAPLGNYGGPTRTYALLPASPAIDKIPVGTNGCGTTIKIDQRGARRPQGSTCDSGAFEAPLWLYLPLVER